MILYICIEEPKDYGEDVCVSLFVFMCIKYNPLQKS